MAQHTVRCSTSQRCQRHCLPPFAPPSRPSPSLTRSCRPHSPTGPARGRQASRLGVSHEQTGSLEAPGPRRRCTRPPLCKLLFIAPALHLHPQPQPQRTSTVQVRLHRSPMATPLASVSPGVNVRAFCQAQGGHGVTNGRVRRRRVGMQRACSVGAMQLAQPRACTGGMNTGGQQPTAGDDNSPWGPAGCTTRPAAGAGRVPDWPWRGPPA